MAHPFLLKKLLVRSGVARWLPGVRRRLEGGGDFLHYFSDHLLSAPFDDLEAVAACLEPHGPEVIDLGQGAPRFDLLPTLSNKLPVDRRDWPPFAGLLELRAAVADKLFSDNGLAFDPLAEVLITAGAMGAVQTVLDAFVNPGDRVVLFNPTSPLFPLAMRGRRVRIEWLESWLEDGRTRFRSPRLASCLRGARLLVINSPGNPTGGVISPEDLEQIAWWAARRDVLILSDEVFERYHFDGDAVSVGSIPAAQRRTLTVGSVSKSHALAAARVGWVAANRHLLRACLAAAALREPFVPTLSQRTALAALRSSPDAHAPILAALDSRRRYAFDRLRDLELNVQWPAGAFFLWVPVWDLGVSGSEFATRLLDAQQVRVIPGEMFGPGGVGHVRISIAAEDGRLQEGLNRLAAFVQGFESAPMEALSRAA